MQWSCLMEKSFLNSKRMLNLESASTKAIQSVDHLSDFIATSTVLPHVSGIMRFFLHPYENRRLTVREALRIQGVDDKYVWGIDRLSQKFKIISNGVPVPLAQAVAKSVFEFLAKNIVIAQNV